MSSHARYADRLWRVAKRPPWRTFLLAAVVIGMLGLAYLAWSPGARVRDGRHDRRANGIWLQHGWLGDDSWFRRNRRDTTLFRDDARVRALADRLASHGMKHVFPHLCPCASDGTIPPVDAAQTEEFLDHLVGISVVPWIGGVLGTHCSPESVTWRAQFVASTVALLTRHPRLAGVQVNIEPLPSGNKGFLALLDELGAALPAGTMLAVAAYPPPTRWHPFPEVHWSEEYFRQVAKRVDLLAPMMYDTGIRYPKLYQHVMANWTHEVLRWAGDTPVLLGVPAYGDAGVGYHDPQVENLPNAIRGIHAGLQRFPSLPGNYLGVAVYCEWEMTAEKWAGLRTEFGRAP